MVEADTDSSALPGSFEEGALPAPPVFLVGPARSGTSLLYKLLCLHPDAAFVSNYVRRVPGVPQLGLLNRMARRRPELQRAMWFGSDSNAYVYGRHRSAVERGFPCPVEGEPLFASCGLTQYPEETPLPRDQQVALLRRRLSGLVAASGARVLVNKRIANNRRIPTLLAAFPDARFVALVRDGRAVALSLSKVDWWLDDRVWWWRGTAREWAEEGGDPWELCARNWTEDLASMEEGLREVPTEQVLRVRYEDFVASPRATMSDIGRFAGLARSAVWQRQLDQLSFPDQNDRWRSSLAPEVVELIESIQRPQLLAHGYL